MVAFVDFFNASSANPTKWSNTFKQFVGSLPTNCLSVFDHFVGLAFEGLMILLLSFYSRFHLLLSLAPLRIDWLPWQQHHSFPYLLRYFYCEFLISNWIGTRNTCKLFFYGDAGVITWVKNILEKLDNELHVKVKKCVK